MQRLVQAAAMTRKLDFDGTSDGDRTQVRACLVDFVPGTLAYLVVLAAVIAWEHFDGRSDWRYLWAVLPVLPALWVVRSMWRHLRRVDEYQRPLLLRGLGGGFAVVVIVVITMGFLELAGRGASMPVAGWIVFGAGMLGRALSSAVASARSARP